MTLRREDEARRLALDGTAPRGDAAALPATGHAGPGSPAGTSGGEAMERSLYETDFYSWTARQAAALRRGAFDEADIANIVEEIESLGRSEEAALESSYAVLCTHLLKGVHQPEMTTRSWQRSVLNSRLAIARLIRKNPGLKPKRDGAFGEAYEDARKVASLETGLPIGHFPRTAPFSRAEAEDEGFLPGRLGWTKDELDAGAAMPGRGRPGEP